MCTERSLSHYSPLSGTAFPPLVIIVDNIILEHDLKRCMEILSADRDVGLNLGIPSALSNSKYWELKHLFRKFFFFFFALKMTERKKILIFL